MDTPRYLLLAQKVFREMADAGVTLSPTKDLIYIERIMLAARRVNEPADPAVGRRMLSPVVLVGGAELRCLPYGVHESLTKLFSVSAWNDIEQELVTAYACAHSHDRTIWQAEHSPKTIWRLVKQWERGINATRVEICAALVSLHRREYAALKAIKTGNEDGWGVHNSIEALIQEYGQTADYWIWTATLTEVEGLLCALRARCDAENEAIARESSGKKGAYRYDADSWSFMAMSALIAERDEIVSEKLGSKDE